MSSSLLIIEVVVPIVGTVALIGLIFLGYRVYLWTKKAEPQNTNRNWRPRFTSTIRGNLVRTYNVPVEQDFVVDMDQEIGSNQTKEVSPSNKNC